MADLPQGGMPGQVGGRAQSESYGCRFDTGPSLLLMPAVYRQTFKALGCHMDDHVTLKRVDPAYRVFFHDNTSIDIMYDVQKMVQQLEAMDPGSGKFALVHVLIC